jgi:hypothetical protein
MYLIPTDGKTKTDLFNFVHNGDIEKTSYIKKITFTHVPGTVIYSE